MAEPARKPDHEFALTGKELAQAVTNYLVKTGRLVPDGRPSEETTLIVTPGAGTPSLFKIWLKGAPSGG